MALNGFNDKGLIDILNSCSSYTSYILYTRILHKYSFFIIFQPFDLCLFYIMFYCVFNLIFKTSIEGF